MSADKTCIEKRLSEAKQGQPLVTEKVIIQMKELLDGELTERQLSAGRLADISKILLANMTIATSSEEGGIPES
jgi:predicted transcriptional regulator